MQKADPSSHENHYILFDFSLVNEIEAGSAPVSTRKYVSTHALFLGGNC